MRVFQVARKQRVKSKDIAQALALIKIEVAASSKIDAETAKKAALIIRQPVRVEEVAAELDLSVEKLLKKLISMKIEVISHLSLLHEQELARLLKLKSFDNLKNKASARKLKVIKPILEVLKIKPKKKRVFEVAAELAVSERAILKKLRQLNSLALHRRSPLDEETIERLKNEQYRFVDKLTFQFMHFFVEIPDLWESFKKIATSTAFYSIILVVLAALISANVLVSRNKLIRQKLYTIQGEPINQLPETYQVLETIALLEIKKLQLKIPIVEEGKDDSPITAVLHKNATVRPGDEGTSLLEDTRGIVSKNLEPLKVNDILKITDIEGANFYYRIIDPNVLKTPKGKTFKFLLNLNLANKRKLVAVLQKVE